MLSPTRGVPFWSVIGLLLAGCSASGPTPQTAPPANRPTAAVPAPERDPYPVMLGIDVLEADGFAAVKGKNIAVMSHVAGVNRQGTPTLDVLRRGAGVKVVALFGIEHGVNDEFPAGRNYDDYVDPKTGLKVFSLYTGRADAAGKKGKPTRDQLRGVDAVVIDLQDIGVRSYTFAVSMRYAIEGCFENGVEVIVLDRPNPLGGLKVDGPLLDRSLQSGVGAYSVPYVHGLTIGEIAKMAKEGFGVLDIPERARAAGKLTVIPMRGWHRSMRWPETGLKFVATSPYVQDFDAVIGYAMVGPGTEPALKGFTHGLRIDGQPRFPFRSLNYPNQSPDQVLATLQNLRLPGLAFRKVTVKDRAGRDTTTVYIDISDWNAWKPTQISFHLIRIAMQSNRPNPALEVKPTDIFSKVLGSAEFIAAMKRDGGRINVESFVADWQKKNEIYVQQVKKYWLYD